MWLRKGVPRRASEMVLLSLMLSAPALATRRMAAVLVTLLVRPGRRAPLGAILRTTKAANTSAPSPRDARGPTVTPV